MNLAEKLNKWAELQAQADALKSEIIIEVMQLRQSIKTDKVIATYSDGRGSFDYESMAMSIEPEDEIIRKHSKTVVDWRKVCEESGVTDEVKAKFYTPGTPYVSLKIRE